MDERRPGCLSGLLKLFLLDRYLNSCSAALAIKVDPAWGAAAVLLY